MGSPDRILIPSPDTEASTVTFMTAALGAAPLYHESSESVASRVWPAVSMAVPVAVPVLV